MQFEILNKKIGEILNNPRIGKPLTANMVGKWRVHIHHFGLIYEIVEEQKIVRLLDYAHHDNIYK